MEKPGEKTWKWKLEWFLDRWGGFFLLLSVLAWIVTMALNTSLAFELIIYVPIFLVSVIFYMIIVGLIVGFIKEARPRKQAEKKERRFGYQKPKRRYGYRK